MTICFVEDIYADFLFDCYIANQRLTDEDWLYYGKEEHHIELPEREGGVLTPLNSQSLTTYQHWIAGVLQSELLGKRCFAMVPRNRLPLFLEALRKKWNNPLSWDVEEQREHFEKTSVAVFEWWQDFKINQPEKFNLRSQRISISNKRKWQSLPKNEMEKRLLRLRGMSSQAGEAAAKVHKKQVEVEFPDGRIGVYPSRDFASLATGMSISSITRSSQSGNYLKHGKCKGYRARYL